MDLNFNLFMFIGLFMFVSIPLDGSCPSGWVTYVSNCYKFVDVQTNAYNASQLCRNEQSELASITSREEDDFINQNLLTMPETWIGLYKRTCVVNDDMHWLDGTQATYSNFFHTEPNEDACCIRTTKDGWKDKTCLADYPYVCKKKLETKKNPFKQVKKPKSGGYLQSPNIAIAEIRQCTPLRCILLCVDVYACHGFNMKWIPFQDACICEFKGSESWMSFPVVEEEGSEFWMDTPTFYNFHLLENSTLN